MLLLFAVIFVQCEKDIELELKKSGDKLVLYSFIYPDSLFRLHFSKSVDVLTKDNYGFVDNGIFKLYINNYYKGKYRFPEDKVSGEWRSFTFLPGDSIHIVAIDATSDTATVNTVIPKTVFIDELDSVSSKYQGTDGILYDVLKCNLTFDDARDVKDFYQLEVIQERWEVIDDEEKYYREVVDYIKDDPVFYSRNQEGTLMEGLDFYGMFDDELIDGTYSLQCLVPSSYYKLYWFDKKIKLTFYLYHHTEDYYRYFRTKLISDYYNGLPIFEPVNIHSNIQNGIGLVSGVSFSLDSLVFVPDE
jgi:hypothetical protein